MFQVQFTQLLTAVVMCYLSVLSQPLCTVCLSYIVAMSCTFEYPAVSHIVACSHVLQCAVFVHFPSSFLLEHFATGYRPISPLFSLSSSRKSPLSLEYFATGRPEVDDPSRRRRGGQSSLEQRRGEVELFPVLEFLFCLKLGNTKCFCRQIVSFSSAIRTFGVRSGITNEERSPFQCEFYFTCLKESFVFENLCA